MFEKTFYSGFDNCNFYAEFYIGELDLDPGNEFTDPWNIVRDCLI